MATTDGELKNSVRSASFRFPREELDETGWNVLLLERNGLPDDSWSIGWMLNEINKLDAAFIDRGINSRARGKSDKSANFLRKQAV